MIDTPYGFQSNADSITAETAEYFMGKFGITPTVATLRRSHTDPISLEVAYAAIRDADFLFSGPGSPSYAVRQWAATRVPALLRARLDQPGAMVFASAAALTLGRLTVPVYEIFKGGADPSWLPGLDVLSAIGIHAAVVPHYDNGETDAYDTRFCFLGEARLEMLEQQLPPSVFILGIDEHTALALDLDAETTMVHGRGGVTIRRAGNSTRYASGAQIPMQELRRVTSGIEDSASAPPTKAAEATDDTIAILMGNLMSLQAESDGLRRRSALVERLVQALLNLRHQARAMAAYEVADGIRDQLLALGVELMDRADGSTDFRVSSGD
ncbi:MAG TPA: hypothetical protein VMZ66_01220 [Aeromicrobium sp.]|nr:hypothetical protein [Aeromicrobium sp.]